MPTKKKSKNTKKKSKNGAAKRPGRPSGLKSPVQIGAVVEAHQAKWLDQRAKKAGVGRSEALRDLIGGAMKRAR